MSSTNSPLPARCAPARAAADRVDVERPKSTAGEGCGGARFNRKRVIAKSEAGLRQECHGPQAAGLQRVTARHQLVGTVVTSSTFVSPPRGDWPPRGNLPASHRALAPRPADRGEISSGEGGSAIGCAPSISPDRGNRLRRSRYPPRGDQILPQRGAIPVPGSAGAFCPPIAGRGRLAHDSRISGAYERNTAVQKLFPARCGCYIDTLGRMPSWACHDRGGRRPR